MYWSTFVPLAAMLVVMATMPPEKRVVPRRWALPAGAIVAALVVAWGLLKYLQGREAVGLWFFVAAAAIVALAFGRSRGWFGPDT